MKYIVMFKVSMPNEDFNKNIDHLKKDGFKIESTFDDIKMFVVNMKDDVDDGSELEKLRSYSFISSVEKNKTYRLIGDKK